MRTVSFVERLEFEFQGNVFSKAIGLGDVDNDQSNELVVGNTNGDLIIHKGLDHGEKPWRKCSDLGTITCVKVGNVCNHDINYLITSCVEGWCHIIAVKPDPLSQDSNETNDESFRILKPTHRQHLAANSKVMVIADIDGDGLMELVIGYSDRRVRSFRWMDAGRDPATGMLQGKFLPLENWQLAGQLGSLTIHKRASDGTVDLMASQPGGTFVTLRGRQPENTRTDKSPAGETDADGAEDARTLATLAGPHLLWHPVGSARARNPGVTTEVVGNISRRKKGEETHVPSYCAICTLDGTLTMLDDDKILWSLYVHHQLFALTKLDVTGDGTEEVVACSSDGHTYIVNLNRDVVRFHFPENVAAFCGGYFAARGHVNVPCLIYLTFNNRICIHYNIRMPQIGLTNLVQTMDERPELQELLNYFNCDPTKPSQIRKLYHWCLYGFQPHGRNRHSSDS